MTADTADSLVVLLHGVGSAGADLAPLGRILQKHLVTTAVAAPDGPAPAEHAGGRQWFSIVGVTEANRPARVGAARADFDRILTEALAAAGLAGRPERMALVGFSQGSIMALDALVSGRWPLAGVVAFSGRLATPGPAAPLPGARALLVHGEADPVIPAAESRRAAGRLADLGIAVDSRFIAGLGHSISPEGVAAARTFLAACLAPTSVELPARSTSGRDAG